MNISPELMKEYLTILNIGLFRLLCIEIVLSILIVSFRMLTDDGSKESKNIYDQESDELLDAFESTKD